jgi:hypothetical protein
MVGMTYQEARRMLVNSQEKRPAIIRRFRRARLAWSQLASKSGSSQAERNDINMKVCYQIDCCLSPGLHQFVGPLCEQGLVD